MILPALLLAAALTPPALLVQVTAPPGVAFNALAPSTVTVTAAGRRQVAAFSGVRDPASPEALNRLRAVPVKLPAGTTGPVTVSVQLFLCDKVRGLCTVQEQTRRVTPTPGRTLTVTFTPEQKGLR